MIALWRQFSRVHLYKSCFSAAAKRGVQHAAPFGPNLAEDLSEVDIGRRHQETFVRPDWLVQQLLNEAGLPEIRSPLLTDEDPDIPRLHCDKPSDLSDSRLRFFNRCIRRIEEQLGRVPGLVGETGSPFEGDIPAEASAIASEAFLHIHLDWRKVTEAGQVPRVSDHMIARVGKLALHVSMNGLVQHTTAKQDFIYSAMAALYHRQANGNIDPDWSIVSQWAWWQIRAQSRAAAQEAGAKRVLQFFNMIDWPMFKLRGPSIQAPKRWQAKKGRLRPINDLIIAKPQDSTDALHWAAIRYWTQSQGFCAHTFLEPELLAAIVAAYALIRSKMLGIRLPGILRRVRVKRLSSLELLSSRPYPHMQTFLEVQAKEKPRLADRVKSWVRQVELGLVCRIGATSPDALIARFDAWRVQGRSDRVINVWRAIVEATNFDMHGLHGTAWMPTSWPVSHVLPAWNVKEPGQGYKIALFGTRKFRNAEEFVRPYRHAFFLGEEATAGLTERIGTYATPKLTERIVSTFALSLARFDKFDELKSLFETLRSRGMVIRAEVWQAALIGLSRNGRVEQVRFVLEQMRLEGLAMNARTYLAVVMSYFYSKQPAAAVFRMTELFRAAKREVADVANRNRLTERDFTSLIRLLLRTRLFPQAIDVIKAMPDYGCEPTTETIEVIIAYYSREDTINLSIIGDMLELSRNLGLVADIRILSHVIGAFFSAGYPNDANHLLTELKDLGVSIPMLAYSKLMGYLCSQNTEEATDIAFDALQLLVRSNAKPTGTMFAVVIQSYCQTFVRNAFVNLARDSPVIPLVLQRAQLLAKQMERLGHPVTQKVEADFIEAFFHLRTDLGVEIASSHFQSFRISRYLRSGLANNKRGLTIVTWIRVIEGFLKNDLVGRASECVALMRQDGFIDVKKHWRLSHLVSQVESRVRKPFGTDR